jgi:hypothetical protein
MAAIDKVRVDNALELLWRCSTQLCLGRVMLHRDTPSYLEVLAQRLPRTCFAVLRTLRCRASAGETPHCADEPTFYWRT